MKTLSCTALNAKEKSKNVDGHDVSWVRVSSGSRATISFPAAAVQQRRSSGPEGLGIQSEGLVRQGTHGQNLSRLGKCWKLFMELGTCSIFSAWDRDDRNLLAVFKSGYLWF